jgi:hypothetical protein
VAIHKPEHLWDDKGVGSIKYLGRRAKKRKEETSTRPKVGASWIALD